MEETHKEKLRKNHCRLKGTIRTQHIAGSLKEKGVLTDDDVDRINNEATDEKRTERLLFILARRSSSAFEAFVQSLREVREQGTCLYEDIVQLLEGADPNQGTDEDKWTHVQSQIKEYIAKRLDPKKACDDLTKSHILTEEESNIIQEEKTRFEKAKSLLCVLSTKGQSAFLALCRVLHDQGLEDIVSFLNRASVGDTLKPVTNVPEPVKHFLKTNDATKVEQALGNSNNPSNIVVSGIPKSGKTQITRRIAKKFRHHHPTAVVWALDGQNRQTLLASMRKLLEALNVEVTDEEDITEVDKCLDQALQNRGTPVLLIVDDLEDGTLLTLTLLRERIQSRVMILTPQEELQLPAEADVLHISVSGFSTEEVEMLLEKNKPKEEKKPKEENKPKEEYQHAFLEALNEAFNHLPLTWASALHFMKISHTSLENFVAQLKEGNTVMDIQEEMKRWMLPHYEKFDPAEESMQLRSAMSKLSSTCWESTSKKSSDGFHSYGYVLPASSAKEKSNPSSHTQSNPEVDVDTLHPQAPNDQPVSRGDSTIPKLGNSKDRHEEEKHETTLAECEDNDNLKTSDGTALEISITPSTGPTSAQCQEVPPCRQMSQEEPTSASNIPIPVLERAVVPPDIDGIQTTHVATRSTDHADTVQERVGGSHENLSHETSAESEHGKVGEYAAALQVEKPRRGSFGASTEAQGFGSSHCTMTANAPSAQSSLATASQVKQCSRKHSPTSEMDSTSSEEVPPTTPPERDAPDPNITAQQQDMAAENIDDSTQLKGPLPTACIEGGIEAEGAVGGRCSPYPSQSASQDQTTPSCYSSGRSSIPCPEVQNVSRALSIGSGWDLVRRRRTEIARRIKPDLACKYLRNANVLTEDECRGIVEDEDEDEDKATSLLCILPAKGQEALLAFCAALRDQSLDDIAALITASQVSDILRPITNVPDPVNNFFPTHDANIVRRAVEALAQHIILMCEVAGSGKTQIARWIAKQFLHHHPTAVVWALVGQNSQTLLASMRKLLEALNAQVTDEEDITKVDECLDRALQNRGTPVLLIVDDLEDGTLLTPTLLRERIQSRVLILTRQEELQLPDETPWPCNLEGGFQMGEGIRFFQIVLEEPAYKVDHLEAVVGAFDGRPLGLAAAREFMHNTHTSPEHYLFLLKEEQTAWILQEEAQRFMAPHYNNFNERNLHPVFQAAHDKVRGARDRPKTDEDTKETCLESPSEYTDDATSSVQDEQDESPEGQEEEEEERMDEGQQERPTLGSQTQAEEAAAALRFEEDAVTSHVQSPDDQDMESLSSDSCSLAASGRSTEEDLELEGAVSGIIFSPPSRTTSEEEEQKMRDETQSEAAASALWFQEEAVDSHSSEDQDTESMSSDNWSLAATAGSIEDTEGSDLEGAVGGILSPPRSRTASGLPSAPASIPPPGPNYARLAVPCRLVQPATRILCQILRLPEPDIRQAMENLSCSGPPGLIVLENQEFPMLPAAGQLGQEQAMGSVHVFSPASEQLIATEEGEPHRFLWDVASRPGLTREVFEHVLDSSFTFRYYVPRRPPESLPFVPRDARIGTGTTVQAVAASEGNRWAWRVTLTPTGMELEFYMDLESSQGGACGNQRMVAHVGPAGLNPEHRPWQNPPMQQSSFPPLDTVCLEAERERLQMQVGQGSTLVRVQRGNGAQLVQEIVNLYQIPAAASCRPDVQFIGESAIDYGGPSRELFVLVWRWLSERYLENGIPRQSPDLEPGTYEFWLAIGRFTLYMFVHYNCFPAAYLARNIMEARNDITDTPELSESESDKTQDLASQNEDRLESDDSVCVTQQGQMVQQDVADLLPDDWETNEPLSDGTEKAEDVVRRKEVKVKMPSNVQSDTVDAGLSERRPTVEPTRSSYQDDTIAGPNLEATTNRGIPDGQLKASTAEKQVSKHDQLQTEVESGSNAEDSATNSRAKTESESFKPSTTSFPTASTSGPSLQNAVKNKQSSVDQDIPAEDPTSKMGPMSDTKNQESKQSLLKAGSRVDARRDDTSAVPCDGEKVTNDGKGRSRDGCINGGFSSDIEQDVTVKNANRKESNGRCISAAHSSHPMPCCANGLGLHIEAINEAISNQVHRTPGQREQFQFHADLPPEQTAVPPEGEHDGHAERNQCRDTDPWIRGKGSSKTASQKSYNELHFGQPPGPTKVAGTPKENKGDNPSEIEQHSNSSQKSVELGTTTSQAGPSTEEDQELEGAVGGMTHPSQHTKEDIIAEVTNRPDANDRPIGKVQGVQRSPSTDELASEPESQEQNHQEVLNTPESGPPGLLHVQGEEFPRLPTFEDPDDAHLYLPQEELRVPDVRDRFMDEQPHGVHNYLPPPPETTESDMASRPTDTPIPGPTLHNTSLKQAVGSSEGRVLERSLSAMTFQRGRSTTMSSRGRAVKKNQAADRANTARCYSCPPVCFVQPYKDQEEGPASSNSLSSDCNSHVQGDNRQVAGTCQQNNCQAGPKITVLDNAQQLLGVIRTSPTPVEQIAYSIRERVFQELVLTAFTLRYPDGDIIPEGTLLGDQDATVIVFPAETDQPGQWRVVNDM
ncbi:uncharacterized protein LOC144928699 [Branchiostoma floridae x Branchiostoma belcheri]